MTKTLGNTDANGTKKNVKDVKFWGNGDAWQLICKASSEDEGWMKSTKAYEIPGVGVVMQTTTQQENSEIISPMMDGMGMYEIEEEEEEEEEHADHEDEDDDEDEGSIIDGEVEADEVQFMTAKNGSYAIADALVFIPGTRIQRVYLGNVLVERKIVAMTEPEENSSGLTFF